MGWFRVSEYHRRNPPEGRDRVVVAMPHASPPQTLHTPVGVQGEVMRSPAPAPAPSAAKLSSEKSDIKMLHDAVNELRRTIQPMTSPGFTLPQLPTRDTSQQAALEASMTFGQKVWKWGRWLAMIVGVGVGIGITYQQFIDGNALDSEVKAAVEKVQATKIAPLETQVAKNTDDIRLINGGVGKLVGRSDAKRKVEKAQSTFDKFQKEHEILVAEYAADKAARKRARKPTRNPAHIQAEDALEHALDELAKVK